MRFDPQHTQKNHFANHVLRPGNNYDYVWCQVDVDTHTHEDFYELLMPAGGDYYHFHNGKEQLISPNTIFLFMPGETHGLIKASPQSVHFSFFAKPSFFNRFFEENPILKGVFGNQTFASCELTDIEHDYLYKLANMLIYQESEYQKVSLFLYNAISLLMLHNENGQNETKKDFVLDLVEKLNNYTYLTTKVRDIYGQYPVARCTLIKDFKDYTGMTIVQYQKKQKLTYATQLLTNSECQITEIAEILEFDSLSHFLRIFKEQYGLTPKEYRRLKKGRHSPTAANKI